MRRIVICCDGTWNTPDHLDGGRPAPTNVVKMARAVRPVAADSTSQIVYYDTGVGTEDILDKVTGGAFGIGLSRNVREAYLFLVDNYAPDDEIYLFGFSRGAYTVRSTAGMVRKVGILRKENADKALEAWDIYRETEGGPDSDRARNFREDNSRWPPADPDWRQPITLVGVWDTVGALGIPGNFIGRKRYEFHDVALSSSVAHGYQALAIDEKRSFFRPTLWEQSPQGAAKGQKMEQAWFPGVHMDAGGGMREADLSDGAFVWMAEKAGAVGLALDPDYLARAKNTANPLGTIHESRQFPYTLVPAYERPIGAGVPPEQAVYSGESNEHLAPSARQRYDGLPSYRPPNLVEYLRKNPAS